MDSGLPGRHYCQRRKGTHMETVKSADGTVIAYDRAGDGPALIVSVGAFCTARRLPRPAISGRPSPSSPTTAAAEAPAATPRRTRRKKSTRTLPPSRRRLGPSRRSNRHRRRDQHRALRRGRRNRAGLPPRLEPVPDTAQTGTPPRAVPDPPLLTASRTRMDEESGSQRLR